MLINSISRTNFGQFQGWIKQPRIQLSIEDKISLVNLSDEIKKKSNNIEIIGYVGTPRILNGQKSIRLEARPTKKDYDEISLMSPPDTKYEDYKKVSVWIPIASFDLREKLTKFIEKQKEYYEYCKQTPDHVIKQSFYKDEFYSKLYGLKN